MNTKLTSEIAEREASDQINMMIVAPSENFHVKLNSIKTALPSLSVFHADALFALLCVYHKISHSPHRYASFDALAARLFICS